MMRHGFGVALALGVLFSAAEAQAQSLPPELEATLKQIASENIRRIRRSVAFGPLVGASGHYLVAPEQVDGGVSFGLGLYLFDVPTTFAVDKIILDRAKRELAARLKVLADEGRAPTGDDLKALARKIYQEARDEILGRNPRQDKTLESPRFGFVVEGQRLFRSEAWQARIAPSLGISVLSIGPTLTLHAGARTTGLVGGEISVRLLPDDGPRSKVIELFGRAEFPLGHKELVGSHLGAGARLLFDVI